MKYRAIIFDLNGVFIKSPYLSDRFKEDFGISLDEFLPALKDVMAQVRLPDADSLYSCWQPYFEKWGVDLTEAQLQDYWFGAEKEVPEMTTLTRRLKAAGIKIFVLSNNFRERAGYYDRTFGFLNEIADKVYYSWQTGLVKPDERAYQLVMDENDLQPEECIYFDDSETNINVATELGIRAYLFAGHEEVENQLKVLGLEF